MATRERQQDAAALARCGIFSLLDGQLDSATQRRRLVPATALVLLTWIGSGTLLGPWVESRFSMTLGGLVSRDMLLAGVVAAVALSAVIAWARGAETLALLATMLLAYLGGTALSGYGFRLAAESGTQGWMRFVLQRAAYGVAVLVPMGLVAVLARRAGTRFQVAAGTWTGETRLLWRGERPHSWRDTLQILAIAFGIPFFLVMQLLVGFEPMRSGALLWFAVPAAIMAVTSAVVEETVFRGLLQPAIVSCAGAGRGLWLQGLFFGLHQGAVGYAVLGTLPGATLFGVGSVLFGKSVMETRGLGWAIAAHAIVGLAVYAAFGPAM